jgi:hypothetical protein
MTGKAIFAVDLLALRQIGFCSCCSRRLLGNGGNRTGNGSNLLRRRFTAVT